MKQRDCKNTNYQQLDYQKKFENVNSDLVTYQLENTWRISDLQVNRDGQMPCQKVGNLPLDVFCAC